MPDNLKLDFDANCAELKIGREVYLRILKAAIGQTRGDLAAMQDAFTQRDIDTLQALSHRLKGDYDNLRIAELSGPARAINIESKTGKDLERIRRSFDEFKNLFESLCVVVDNIK